MDEPFLGLSLKERREVINLAADRSGRPAHLLEKDIWVVWSLSVLYDSPLGEHLVFKGGTSLSKAYNVIRRFSEDVDLTYDIRVIASDLVPGSEDPLPPTKSQEKKWTKEIRQRLQDWLFETAEPTIARALADQGLVATMRLEDDGKLFLDYEAATAGSGYVAPTVVLEFGARSTGEPASIRDVTCDALGVVEGVTFPMARPRVMHAERTFWEKATAIHVFCLQQKLRGARYSRHWHDIVRLDETGFADLALADRELAKSVARQKSIFFAEKVDGSDIDYFTAVEGGLCLVPSGDGLKALEEDYARMVEDGLLLEDAEPFDRIVQRCADLALKANQVDSEVGTRNSDDQGSHA